MIKKVITCFAGILLTVTCAACKTGEPYLVKDYLNDLAIMAGIGEREDHEENLLRLNTWGVTDKSDSSMFEDKLNYDYLAKTIGRLLEINGDYLGSLKERNYIDKSVRGRQNPDRETTIGIIDKAVNEINNRYFEPVFDCEYVEEPVLEEDKLRKGDLYYSGEKYYVVEDKDENDEPILREAEFAEVFESLEVAESYVVDFTDAEVIPYGEEIEDTAYINEKYTLLASSDNHVFNSEGFRVSYTLNSSGIDVHISKDVNGMNVYGDVSVHNVRPTLKYYAKKDDLKNCYFDLKFNTTEKIGVSSGKYGNYHVTLKDLDSSSFMGALKSIVEPAKDEVEATIPIAKIRTPIPQIPTVSLDLDLLIKLYASGKAEVVLYNTHEIGFETKNGQIRYIHENTHDLDSILQASAKAALGLNIGVSAAGFKLADAELDGGIRGVLNTTVHLYDKQGNLTSQQSDIAYSTLYDLAQSNPDVKVCGDLSLYWMLDMTLNTSKTQMNKLGFSRTFSILDDDNQVFGNLHHIENGHFVNKCTRNERPQPLGMEVTSNRIVLDSYAEVLQLSESYTIVVLALPQGYTRSDLKFSSYDASIATVDSGIIRAVSPGSVKIHVETKDGKYDAIVNILVSTG